MHRRLHLTPVPLAAFAVFIALVGCGGAATPTAPTAAPTAAANDAPAAKNSVPALGITDAAKWYNTAPLTLEALRGKPVFLVFWSDI